MPDVVLATLYLVALLSPIIFPQQVDNLMDGNPMDYEEPPRFGNKTVIMTDFEYDPNDAKVLSNLTLMVERTENPDARRVWEIKRHEFLRQMKWRKEKTITNGSERRTTHG